MLIVIVIPPFGGIDRPALGPHILQACTRATQFKVLVKYGNITFARRVGFKRYNSICFGPSTELLGERIFARLAHHMPALGTNTARAKGLVQRLAAEDELSPSWNDLVQMEKGAEFWLQETVRDVLQLRPSIVGCSTTFEQTNASIALLRHMKKAASYEITTVLGGANCDGSMGAALQKISGVDYVFSGECEQVFPAFLTAVVSGASPRHGVVSGMPNLRLDDIPPPDFSDYYNQLDAHKEELGFSPKDSWLPYETSRGCWWGERSHCTFCGINGQTMTYRQKSAAKVLNELDQLASRHPNKNICMVDNIMPLEYFKDLIPALGEREDKLHLFYEQKANLTLNQVGGLKSAGVNVIQPGIESLNSDLLRLMRKGVSARQNIALLRYCRIHDVSVNWNILFGFPGDEAQQYSEMTRVIPLLAHLHPPTGVYRLSIDRFSPYHISPSKYGIKDVRPLGSYYDVFPDAESVGDIAYHFAGTYESGSLGGDETIQRLANSVQTWRLRWREGPLPALFISQFGGDDFVAVDSRACDREPRLYQISRRQAEIAVHGVRISSLPNPEIEELVRLNFVIMLDGFLVPLATCNPETFHMISTVTSMAEVR